MLTFVLYTNLAVRTRSVLSRGRPDYEVGIETKTTSFPPHPLSVEGDTEEMAKRTESIGMCKVGKRYHYVLRKSECHFNPYTPIVRGWGENKKRGEKKGLWR